MIVCNDGTFTKTALQAAVSAALIFINFVLSFYKRNQKQNE
jgi:hypothetical protein